MRRIRGLAVLVLVACGSGSPESSGDADATDSDLSDGDHLGDDAGTDDEEAQDGPPVTPVITNSTFPVLHAGDTITFIGVHFLAPGEGSVAVRFVGAFSSDQASWYDVDFRAPATAVSTTRATLVFEPGFPPDGFGRALGTFAGTIALINIDAQGRESSSLPVHVELEAGRSLLVHGVRPAGVDCGSAFASKVRSESTLALELEVVGFPTPTVGAPIVISAGWDDAPTSSVDELATFAAAVEVPTPFAWQGAMTTLVVTAEASPVDTAARRLTFDAFARHAIPYDGGASVVERFAPVRVSDCLGPGIYAYSESTNEGRTRSYTTSGTVTVSVWAINEAFGFSVTSSTSSGSGVGLGVTGVVDSGMSGAFFRQTTRLLRTAPFIERDACGEPTQVGEIVVTDWAWVPGFNQLAGACPPYPEPLLSANGALLMP